MEQIRQLSPIMQSILATCFTYLMTILGASLVFFFKRVNRKFLDIVLGFGAGVMIAGSFWSLLTPAIEICEELYSQAWVIPSIGFLFGGLFIILSDKVLNKCNFDDLKSFYSQNPTGIKRSILLVTAIAMHNIPEGIAVGVAFGGAVSLSSDNDFIGAVALSLGIALQNFPEGASVALQIRGEGFSRKRSFIFGQMTGIVEPLAGIIGVIMAISITGILPFLLSFSAGAMIAVVSLELIPEASRVYKQLGTLGVTFGFILMMIIEILL